MNYGDHKKLTVSLRSRLLGEARTNPEFYDAVIALDLAIKYHNDFRKDGKPTIIHQLSIALFAYTLIAYFKFPVAIIVACLLHDTYEDYPESESEIKQLLPQYFDYIYNLSKVRYGSKIDYDIYFKTISECPICSIVKLIDRIHNLSTMQGAFKPEKQAEYVLECEKYFFPMLKKAKRKFLFQEMAYENIKTTLLIICRNIRFSLPEELFDKK